MKCQNCNEREANIEYTQIINGQKMKLILCDKCAKELNIGIGFNFGLDNIFSSFFSEANNNEKLENFNILKCPTCMLTYDNFVNNGRFGCSDCYTTFDSKLDEIFKRIHGGNRHLGKRIQLNRGINEEVINSNEKQKESEIDKLKEELQAYIENEEYEKAAITRDKIRSLEKNNKNDKTN